jgi:predicted porin
LGTAQISMIGLGLLAAVGSAMGQERPAPTASSDEVNVSEAAAEAMAQRKAEIGSEGDDVGGPVVAVPTLPDAAEVKTVDLIFYGSARVRTSASDGELRISDNRTRVGMYGYKFIRSDIDMFSRIELGTDLGGQLDNLLLPPENPRAESSGSIFLRVGNVGVGTKYGDISVGKQWSTYYNVAGFTDRFAVYGAQGAQAYNAGTDGGGTGTGRADRSLKYASRTGNKLSIGLQIQDDGSIPLTDNQTYDAGAGASAVYKFSSQWTAGAAYNHAVIDELDTELTDLGLTGDSQAFVAGVQYAHEPLFIAATYASHDNQAATNEGQFVDADGFELYGRYKFNNRLRVIGGANYLEPDSDDPDAGQYDIRSIIIGLQYTYGDLSFGDLIYFEAELRDGRQVDGTKSDNAYTAGIRYSFEL